MVSGTSGVAFVQATEDEDGHENHQTEQQEQPAGRRAHIQCFNCGKMGHYANQCRDQQQGTTLAQAMVAIPKHWVLLDNQSTIHLFSNSALLQNIRTSKQSMLITSNGGSIRSTMKGVYPGYGEIWYNPNAIANILSLKAMRDMYPVTYDSENGNSFVVDMGNNGTMQFKQSPAGLYYYDAESEAQVGVAMINTVASNMSKYSNDDYLHAVKARKMQVLIGRPATRDYIHIVKEGLLPNCPVNEEDVIRAEDIFGPEVGCLKGKTTRCTSPQVEEIRQNIPTSLLSQYRDIIPCVDVMHVNRIPFLVTVSKHIRFATMQEMQNRKIPSLLKAIRATVSVYKQRGFRVKWALMDNEFEPVRGALAELGIGVNETGRDEHVPQVEQLNRTIKERAWATCNMLPFQHMPTVLVIEMVKAAVFWLNAFPNKNGVSERSSPRTIVTGKMVDYTKHCKYEFGEYVQVHEEHDNSMTARTVGAIALRPTENTQGNWLFMSLLTGRVLNRTHATKLPMPAEVIERVHTLARRQKANPGLVFTDRFGHPDQEEDEMDDADDDASIYHENETGSDNSDDDDDESYRPSDDDDDDDDDNDDDDNNEEYHVGADEDVNNNGSDVGENIGNGLDSDVDVDESDSDYNPDEDTSDSDDDVYYDAITEDGNKTDSEENIENTGEHGTEDIDNSDHGNNTGVQAAEDGNNDNEATIQADLERGMDARYGPRMSTYNL
jgi:hypothetical protein